MDVAFYVKEYDPGLLLVIARALYGFARLWEIKIVLGYDLHTWLYTLILGGGDVIIMSSICIEEARWN